jgi:hypothetical protein
MEKVMKLNLRFAAWAVLGVSFYFAGQTSWTQEGETVLMFSILLAIAARIVQAEVHHQENKVDRG